MKLPADLAAAIARAGVDPTARVLWSTEPLAHIVLPHTSPTQPPQSKEGAS